MSLIGSEISRALLDIEGKLDEPKLTWKGAAYICVPRASSEVLALTPGGLSPDAAQVFILRKSQFSTAPKAKEFVTHAGVRYVIRTAATSACGTYIVLTCDTPDKGA